MSARASRTILTPARLFGGLLHRGRNPSQLILIDTPDRRATPEEVDAVLGPVLEALKKGDVHAITRF